jgi:hypothetical protein
MEQSGIMYERPHDDVFHKERIFFPLLDRLNDWSQPFGVLFV